MSKAYPKYKPSGVEWLGDVPEHWEVKRLRHLLSSIRNGTSATQVDEEESALPVTRIETISKGIIDYDRIGYIEKFEGVNSYKLDTGDILLSHINSLSMIGNAAIYNGEKILYSGMNLLRLCPKKMTDSKWLWYFIVQDGFRKTLSSRAKPAINQASLTTNQIREMSIVTPPLPEQQAIAAFLDRETGRIDTLIAKKERLLELLAEQRTALISRAVTKGLDASVKLKPSGVEWLGDVPEHWEVKKIVFLLNRLQDGTHFSPDSDFTGEYLYITAKNIKENGFNLSEITFVTKEAHKEIYRRCPVKKGDVLYIKDGATAGIAMVNTLEEEFSMLSSVAMLRPRNTDLDSVFLKYHLNTEGFKNFVLNSLVGGAMTRFTLEIISKFRLITPPLPEQQAIASFLDRETAKIDALSAKVTTAIERLKEYRTALISSAVTGKIDVREAV